MPAREAIEASTPPADLARHGDGEEAAASQLGALRRNRIAALARRAASHRGALRELLDRRLAELTAAADAAQAAACPATQMTPPPQDPAESLASLLERLSVPLAGRGDAGIAPPHPADELQTLRLHRDTWSRLRGERRLRQALKPVAANAGPLNTARLLNQALTTMCAASPSYLQHFLAQVEALLWLDQAHLSGPAAGAGTMPSRRDRRGSARRQA